MPDYLDYHSHRSNKREKEEYHSMLNPLSKVVKSYAQMGKSWNHFLLKLLRIMLPQLLWVFTDRRILVTQICKKNKLFLNFDQQN